MGEIKFEKIQGFIVSLFVKWIWLALLGNQPYRQVFILNDDLVVLHGNQVGFIQLFKIYSPVLYFSASAARRLR